MDMKIDFLVKGTEKISCKYNECKKPKLSVIIITYNHEKYIKECLDSILSQKTDFDLEILLGEDDSEDRTREICIEYAEKYPEKISLFLHDRNNVIYVNGKPTGNYNFIYSITKARGEYIAICEGDDYWIDDCKLQKQVDALEKHKEHSICFHDVVECYEDSKKSNFLACKKQKEVTLLQDILQRNYIPTCSVVFRNQNITNIPHWFVKSMAGDWLLHLINAQYGSILYIDKVMGVHRIHQGCIWSSNTHIKNILTSLEIYDLLEENFKPCKEEYRWAFLFGKSNLIYQLAYEYKKRKSLIRSYYFLTKSLFLRPGFSFLDPRVYVQFYKG